MSAPVATAPRARRRRAPEATGSGSGWKEQVRRISELCLLGVVAALLSLCVLPLGAVVATVSRAVGHWADTDDLPPWSETAREFGRRFLPGVPVGVATLLAGWLVAVELGLLRSGTVPGGDLAAGALLVVVAVLLAAVLLGIPQLADGPAGRGWRPALAGGWLALRRVPLAGAAALAVTAVAALLALTLPGVFLVLPALWVLSLHAVHRRLVLPRLAPATTDAADAADAGGSGTGGPGR